MGQQHAAGGARAEVHLGTELVGDAGYLGQRQDPQIVAFAGQGEKPLLLAWPAGPAAVVGGTGGWPAGLTSAAGRAAVSGAARRARRPGATGHSSMTQRRNPPSVEGGATARRSAHRMMPPMMAIGVASSSARTSPRSFLRAMAQARMTSMSVSLASAYTADGITQIARLRQPGAEARAFMARLMPTQATFSARARIARLPCSARAMPRAAKMTAPTSGMPASSAAMAGLCLTAATITNWASQLTAAAAAASTARAHIAPRSHPPARPGPPPLPSFTLTHFTPPRSGACSKSASVSPNGCQPAEPLWISPVIAMIGLVFLLAQPGQLRAQVRRGRQRRVEQVVEQAVDALAADQGELPQPGVHPRGDPGGQPGTIGLHPYLPGRRTSRCHTRQATRSL